MPLTVSPLEARLNRDTDMFSKMVNTSFMKDPYCVIHVRNEHHSTKPHNEGGKNPHWNETFQFNERSDLLRVIIKDKDIITSDVVGEGLFNISRAYTHPNQVETCTNLCNISPNRY